MTAMETQLFEKYIKKPIFLMDYILLVGICVINGIIMIREGKKLQKISIEELKNDLENQENKLKEKLSGINDIRSFVLNLSL